MENRNEFGKLLAVLFTLMPSYAGAETLTEDVLSIEAEIPRNGSNIAYGHAALWVASGFVALRVDREDNSVQEIKLDGASQKQRRIFVGEKAIWIPDAGADKIYKIDPSTAEVALVIDADLLSSRGSITVWAGSVWAVTGENFEKMLTRFNAESGAVEARIDIPSTGYGVAEAGGSIWVTSGMKGEVYRIDPKNNDLVQTVEIGGSPRLMVAGAGWLWVHDQADGSVKKIDTETGEIVSTISTELPGGAGEIVYSDEGITLSTPYTVQYLRIDTEMDTVRLMVIGRQGADDHAIGGGSLWLGGSKIRRVKLP